MSGVIPAIPLIFIRPFLPESPVWQQKKAAGTLKRPSIAALFAPELRRTTIVTTRDVCDVVRRGVRRDSADSADRARTAEVRQMVQGLPPPQARLDRAARCIGRDQGAGGRRTGRARRCWRLLALVIVSRQRLIRMFQIPGLIVMPIVFGW